MEAALGRRADHAERALLMTYLRTCDAGAAVSVLLRVAEHGADQDARHAVRMLSKSADGATARELARIQDTRWGGGGGHELRQRMREAEERRRSWREQ